MIVTHILSTETGLSTNQKWVVLRIKESGLSPKRGKRTYLVKILRKAFISTIELLESCGISDIEIRYKEKFEK